MNYVKEHKKLQRLVESHGLVYEKGSAHYVVRTRDGKRLSNVSHSPSDMNFARQAVRDLVRMGALPTSAKGMKF